MSDKKKIGALWNKTTPSGKDLMTGNVEVNGEKIKISVWKNGFKAEGTRQPDYIIYEDTYLPLRNNVAIPPASDQDDTETPF
jgi:hypothetical protein